MRRLTEQHGKILAKQFVQRTRGDVLSAWPGEVRFPKRDPLEAIYSLTGEHHKLFADVLAFTRETVQDPSSANRAVRYAITAPGMYGSLVGFAELAISFSLMFTVLVVTNHEKIAPYTALVVGAMIATYITLESPLSGMSTNPARTFGSAFHAGYWHALWIYFIAPNLWHVSRRGALSANPQRQASVSAPSCTTPMTSTAYSITTFR